MLTTTTKVPVSSSTGTHPSIRFIALSFASAFVLMMTLAGHTAAQTFRGTILGTVTDPNGAVIPAATVTARNVGTGIERSKSTDVFGNYTVTDLQIGIYQVIVT
jgi:hypothetical protein